jgi:hypothetical protein
MEKGPHMYEQCLNFKVVNGLALLLSRGEKMTKSMDNFGCSFNAML